MSSVIRLLLAAVLAIGLALLPSGAWAHAGLVDSDPRDGATLDALPAEVSLTFTEDINPPAYVVVRSADGADLAEGDTTVEGPVVRQALATGEPGDYTLAYSVVSADGHRVTGELAFTVAGAEGADPTAGASPTADPSGTPDAEDAPADGTDDDSESDSDSDAGGSTLSVVLLVVGAVVVLGALAVAVGRRRAR